MSPWIWNTTAVPVAVGGQCIREPTPYLSHCFGQGHCPENEPNVRAVMAGNQPKRGENIQTDPGPNLQWDNSANHCATVPKMQSVLPERFWLYRIKYVSYYPMFEK